MRMERLTTLYINKESHKFSAAHYTIFSATERERLHGHNYAVSLRLVAPMGDNGFSADYNVYKNRLADVVATLDEYMLLPEHSPHQSVHREGDEYVARYNGEVMRFLAADTLLLPVTNITVEELSHYLLGLLMEASAGEDLREVELAVASGPGQRGAAIWRAD